MRKILFISRIIPNKTKGGAPLRTYLLIKVLSQLYKDKVVVIINTNDKFANNDILSLGVKVVHYNFNRNHLFFPFFRDKVLLNRINTLLKKESIEFAFIDYSFYGQYINFFKKKQINIIYSTHNYQSDLVKQRVYENSIMNLLNKYVFYPLTFLHEKIYFKSADKIIAVSDDDMLKYERIVSQNKVVVIPNFMDELKQDEFSSKQGDYIVFSGSFSAFQNIEGFKWFYSNIWSDEIRKLTKLILVGSGSDLLLKRLNINDSRIEATGWVEDTSAFIKNAKLAIVPLLHGSGTRFKCIEAMMYKTPLIGTYKGTEGIINRDKIFILEDNYSAFKQKIVDVLEKPDQMFEMTELAYETFKKEYSFHANKKRIALLLNNLKKK